MLYLRDQNFAIFMFLNACTSFTYKTSTPTILIQIPKLTSGMYFRNKACCSIFFLFIACVLSLQFATAQNTLPLTDFSFFQPAGSTWKIVGDVGSDLSQKSVLTTTPGTGVIANITDFSNPGQDLISTIQHGDMDLELDYMSATGSNSGIFLQGRYEVQLADSWGVVNPTSADNGAIGERWNETRPEGQKSFEGYAPRQNATKAPGLWQHIRISFQAPRFGATGQKIENAKILRIELNGVSIHDNVELSGPTRDAMGLAEVPVGPLKFQGSRGSVAFKNIKITMYDKPRPELINLKYSIYKGRYDKEPDYKKLPPEAQGSSVILSSNVNTIPNEFLIHYTGTIKVKEPGEYNFNLNTAGGKGSIKINDKVVIALPEGQGRGRRVGRVTLPQGDFPFELLYTKFVDFARPALGLAVTGPGIREYILSDANITQGGGDGGDPVDPIPVIANANTVLRSFADYDTIKITHAVSVGSPQQVHYTYDLDNGSIVQVWRGNFLDATSMWHSRGDGTARPAGMVQKLGRPMLAVQTLASQDAAWGTDTAGTGYRAKGYILDKSDRPTFRYMIYNTMVNDMTRVMDNNQGLRRDISLQNPVSNLYLRLATAKSIEPVANNLYLLDGKSYYLRIDDAENAKPIIRDANGQKEMIIPVKNKVSYSILF
jgi:hypothetical protein